MVRGQSAPCMVQKPPTGMRVPDTDLYSGLDPWATCLWDFGPRVFPSQEVLVLR